MKIEINTFERDSIAEVVQKIVEEAAEVSIAYAFYTHREQTEDDDLSYAMEMQLIQEIGDVFTATANLCARLGFDGQKCVELAEVKNIRRGYYDTMDS